MKQDYDKEKEISKQNFEISREEKRQSFESVRDDKNIKCEMDKKATDKLAPMTINEYYEMRHPLWIEKHKDFTLVTLFRYVGLDCYRVDVNVDNFKIIDMNTKDTYKCRGIYGSNEKHIAYDLMNHQHTILPVELVFPPLEDGVEKLPQSSQQLYCKRPIQVRYMHTF